MMNMSMIDKIMMLKTRTNLKRILVLLLLLMMMQNDYEDDESIK